MEHQMEQLSFLELTYHRKGHPVAARVVRKCYCTIEREKPHDWTPTCDRYPPLSLERADGTLEPIEDLRVCLKGEDLGRIISAKPISAARWRYLRDLEQWAIVHDQRHPIVKPHWRARRHIKL